MVSFIFVEETDWKWDAARSESVETYSGVVGDILLRKTSKAAMDSATAHTAATAVVRDDMTFIMGTQSEEGHRSR